MRSELKNNFEYLKNDDKILDVSTYKNDNVSALKNANVSVLKNDVSPVSPFKNGNFEWN